MDSRAFASTVRTFAFTSMPYVPRNRTLKLRLGRRCPGSGEAEEIVGSRILRMSVGTNPELRLAEPNDVPGIAKFLLELGGPQFPDRYPGKSPEDFFRWKYFQNPVGDAIVGVAVHRGRFVSAVAGVPKRLAIGAEILLVYELGDFLTAPDFR